MTGTDLLVVGGGPAGLATATLAARAGLRTALIEPRSGPIDKACGEGLMPGAVEAVRELAGVVAGVPFRGIRYVDGSGREARALFTDGTGRGVRRTTLQPALLQAARDAGVEVRTGRVTGVRQDVEGVDASLADGTGLRTRWLVAADGLHSPVRAALGLDAPVRGRARYGLRRHFAVEPWTDLVEVHWARDAEAYVTPVAPDLVGVALLVHHQGPFEQHLRQFPRLAERLPAAPATSARSAGPLRQRSTRRVAGRVLLVGDAAGYVDALTGEGIAVSLASARVLVDALVAERPGDYEQAWLDVSRRYRLITSTLLAASRVPPVRPALVPAARALPGVFRRAVDQLEA
ncbi:NAD(P)/FAD-dependent oxidoreductase [Angustibacter aerolatus]